MTGWASPPKPVRPLEKQKVAAAIPQLEDIVYQLECLRFNLHETRYDEFLPEIEDCLSTLRVVKVKVVPIL